MSPDKLLGLSREQVQFVVVYSLAVVLIRALACEICMHYARWRGYADAGSLRMSLEEWYSSYGLLTSSGGFAVLIRAAYSPSYLVRVVAAQTGELASGGLLLTLEGIGCLGYLVCMVWWGSFRRCTRSQMRGPKFLALCAHHVTAFLVLGYGALMLGSMADGQG